MNGFPTFSSRWSCDSLGSEGGQPDFRFERLIRKRPSPPALVPTPVGKSVAEPVGKVGATHPVPVQLEMERAFSQLCDEVGLPPTVFYRWQEELPLAANQHWHIDVSYIHISGAFYYLCSILDGCSRYIVNWDLLSATGSWRRRGSNGRFAASKPFDVQLTSVGRGSG